MAEKSPDSGQNYDPLSTEITLVGEGTGEKCPQKRRRNWPAAEAEWGLGRPGETVN